MKHPCFHQAKRPFRPMILGQFSPQVLACVRSWGRQGWQPGFISIGHDDIPAPKSRYLRQWFHIRPDLLQTDAGLEAVRACMESFQASGLICIQEKLAMWLDENRQALEDFQVWVAPFWTTERVLSKRRQIQTAKKVGLDTLPTYELDQDRLDVLQDVSESHFPLCLRPSGEGGVVPGFKVKFIQTWQEGREFVQSFQSIKSPLIAQPFRNLPNLVVHGARSLDGENFGLQGFLVERKFEGLTLTIRPMELSLDFEKRCIEFTREMDIVGNYHFEFLYDPCSQESYFLELNARLGGTTAKVCALGYDEPVFALQAFGIQASQNQKAVKGMAASRLALAKYLHYSIANKITPLDYPKEPKWKRIACTLGAMATCRDDVISLGDLKGTVAFYRQALAGKK